VAKGGPRAELDRPAAEVCRRLVLDHLGLAAAACGRLADHRDDAEALHDFRVALRRLRGTLRAFPEPLAGAVGKRWVRRLGDLAGRTGDGRDAEVALAWVEAQRPHLNWRQRRGLDRYAERLAERKERAYARALRGVPGRFAALAERLRRRLDEGPAEEPRVEGGAAVEAPGVGGATASSPPAPGGEGPAAPTPAPLDPTPAKRDRVPPVPAPAPGVAGRSAPPAPLEPAPFALVLAEAARRCSSRLIERLGRLGGAGDERAAHRARIAAKRLRYILEPAAGEAPEARAAVRALKRLQDLLGELHDAHVLERELAAAVEKAAGERARELLAAALSGGGPPPPPGRWDVVGGLVALARRNRERRDELFAELAKGWLAGPKTANLAAKVGGLAARLEARVLVGRSEPMNDSARTGGGAGCPLLP
jgi:CHAD domain-containing protein